MTTGNGDARVREAHKVPDGPAQLEVAAVSDRGTVRDENQDGWSIVPLAQVAGCAILVADGMGGHVGGREAAHAALMAASDRLRDAADPHLALAHAFDDADAAVGSEREGGTMSGTTLVGAVITESRVRVANIGDSRAYVVRGEHVVVVTNDHSLLGEQMRSGLAETSAQLASRNLLTRAVTGDGAPADFFDLFMEPGDVLLLCSDGFWGVLDDSVIRDIFTTEETLAEQVERGCDAALAAGSRDNVTVVACRSYLI